MGYGRDMPADERDAPKATSGRNGQALRAFFCQNVAVGCAFGGFGVAVLPLQAHFGVSRGMVTLGLPLVALAMGMVSPLVAILMGRIGLRRTMFLGVLLSALGYVAIALAPNFAVVLAAYALPIGIGSAMFGPFPSSVLANNWFQPRPGRAVGFVNVPLFAAILPIASLVIIDYGGLVGFYLFLAALHLLLLPLVMGIVDRPPGVIVSDTQSAVHAPAAILITQMQLLREPLFWVMVLGMGLLSSVGITGAAHLFAFAREAGGTATQAGLVMTLFGAASIVGSLLIGLICDKIGAQRGLALVAIGFSLSWLMLYLWPTVLPLMAAGLLIGACGAAVFPAVNVFAGQLYGVAALPRVIGLIGLFTLPFTFMLPPLAGVLHDQMGGYAPVAAAIATITMAVAVMFLAAGRIAKHGLRGEGQAVA